MSGRKPIIINFRATSLEGEVSYFRTFKDAAKELGFNDSSIKRAYHANRNRIGEYELEWLDIDEGAHKKTYRSIGAKVKEEHSNYLEKAGQERLVKEEKASYVLIAWESWVEKTYQTESFWSLCWMLSKSIKKFIPYQPFHQAIDETLKIPEKCWASLCLNFARVFQLSSISPRL